ncbi:hypothetical protein GCM10010294_39560 [Streptomyces griseoloalbus]|nr:hypothetical protein GCM10010294_39560 [Streptomyces griseoloalbus]
MTGSDTAPTAVDTGRPRPARVHDRRLGGRDSHPVGEEPARGILAADATVLRGTRAGRRSTHRAVRTGAEAGTRPFPDIGTGVPTEPHPHQVAQGVEAESVAREP